MKTPTTGLRPACTSFGYRRLGKADKGAVKAYVEKVTAFSRVRGTRLIAQYRHHGRSRDRRGPRAAVPWPRPTRF